MKRKLKDHETQCHMCNKPIDIDRSYSVEFSNTNGEYYQDSVPEGHDSLGWFMVGPDCYKKALKSGRTVTETIN